MGKEIERKFLVDASKWKNVKKESGKLIKQGYLHRSVLKTIRIRHTKEIGYITIKGKTSGITRLEYEYKIPASEAEELLAVFCDKYIEKTRYIVKEGTKKWEVDEFHNPNKGLILAEIELNSENEIVELPNWATEEVTGNPLYYNANMLNY